MRFLKYILTRITALKTGVNGASPGERPCFPDLDVLLSPCGCGETAVYAAASVLSSASSRGLSGSLWGKLLPGDVPPPQFHEEVIDIKQPTAFAL